ncbi:MAG TPA: carbohydrate ABC transporter permease [Propionibacteriaceae bacterium]|nr:carbohydrate ABC transporter permease [Propionibacteriaceae bacterium]
MLDQPTIPQAQTATEDDRSAVTHRRPSPRKRAGLAVRHVILVVLALLTLFPVVLIISTVFKTPADIRTDPFGLFTSFSMENLVSAWTVGRFSDYLLNSILLSVPSTLAVVAISTMAGYAFARLPFPGRTVIFYTVLLGLLVPFFTYMIPLYFQLRSMGLLDTLVGANLVLTLTGIAFGTFFMRAFFSELPEELEQAARVDGCSELQIFVRVMMPLTSSGMGALAVFTFLSNWNNFLVPLLYRAGITGH